ncbi:hypothetical protein QJQ45_012356 [Haematococcus lacustris]|nr:hypothetical protein QJQ45_012198 [Haematococcus lacustris]KAJ9514423.1 hypothetical protein QJQ45_012356 [Haematococcus lacustris]
MSLNEPQTVVHGVATRSLVDIVMASGMLGLAARFGQTNYQGSRLTGPQLRHGHPCVLKPVGSRCVMIYGHNTHIKPCGCFAAAKAAKAKPAPQPGRWLDRDCNAALNMQRIGESRWRPLELCYWPEQGALPAKGKEYPGLGYKRLRDKPPKAQQQQQQLVEAQ